VSPSSPGLELPLASAGLALAYGTTMFLGAAALLTSPRVIGHTEHLETFLYLMVFGAFLPLAVVAAARRIEGVGASRRSALATANLAAVALLLILGRAGFDSGGSPVLRKVIFAGTLLIAAGNVFASQVSWHSNVRLPAGVLLPGVVILVVFALDPFVPRHAFMWHDHVGTVVLAVLFALLFVAAAARVRRAAAADVVVVVFLVLATADFTAYEGSLRADQDFYLGPVNAVLHGHTMLVDTFSQYGVGVMYFLAALFKVVPLGYGGFQLIEWVLTALELIVVYAVLRMGCRQPLYAVIGAFVCLIAGVSSGVGPYVRYASTGPLRFGLPWLVIAAATFQARRNRRGPGLEGLMLFLVGIAAVWSFETFVYTAGTYLAVVALNSVLVEGDRRERGAEAVPRAARLAATLAVAYLLLALGTRVHGGAWPHWRGYLDYVRLYSAEGFSTELFAPWSLGYLIAGLYFVTGAAVFFLIAQKRAFVLAERAAVVAIVGTTAFGILAYTYFLGRSDPNNLHHIAPPAIVLGTLWVGLLGRSLSPTRARVLLFTLAGFAAGATVAQIQHPTQVFSGTQPVRSVHVGRDLDHVRAMLDSQPSDPKSVEAAALLGRYGAGDSRVAVVLDAATETTALVRAGKGDLLPIADPTQDALLPAGTLPLVESALGTLRPGDVVLSERNFLDRWRSIDPSVAAFPEIGADLNGEPRTNYFEAVVLREILRRFRYRVVASAPSGVVVLRLGSPRDDA
jgi:hypothetical protein